MNSNSEKKIETIEQFREWLHNLGEIQLPNGQMYEPFEFGPNGDHDKMTPDDELMIFLDQPFGTTESEWLEKITEWVVIYIEQNMFE